MNNTTAEHAAARAETAADGGILVDPGWLEANARNLRGLVFRVLGGSGLVSGCVRGWGWVVDGDGVAGVL